MSNIEYFLVYDEDNNARVREVFEQNGVKLVKTKGKVKTLRVIGYEIIDPEMLSGLPYNRKPIYKIVGEASVNNTI